MAIIEAESQEKLLYLLINHSSLVPDFLSQQIGLEFFEPKYRPIIAAIELAHNSSEQFTENYFIDYIIKSVSNGDYKKLTGNDAVGVKIAQTNERRNYHSVATLDKVDPADFPLVCRKVRENYIKNKSGDLLDKFNKKRQQDYVSAVTLLSEELTSLVSNNSETGASTWVTVDDFYDNWYKSLEQEINNPKKVLLTGIKPFDETMPIGLDPGSLTLIVADVGGFKSATMINIALNVCKVFNENVLYVSLEMPKDRLMQRIISRESGVDSEKLSKPSMLTAEEKSKIENAGKDFKKRE
jgi:replicative DNA helicase